MLTIYCGCPATCSLIVTPLRGGLDESTTCPPHSHYSARPDGSRQRRLSLLGQPVAMCGVILTMRNGTDVSSQARLLPAVRTAIGWACERAAGSAAVGRAAGRTASRGGPDGPDSGSRRSRPPDRLTEPPERTGNEMTQIAHGALIYTHFIILLNGMERQSHLAEEVRDRRHNQGECHPVEGCVGVATSEPAPRLARGTRSGGTIPPFFPQQMAGEDGRMGGELGQGIRQLTSTSG